MSVGGELRFDGRVALVTGGGRGMGRVHAEYLSARGANIVVSDLGSDIEGAGADAGVAEDAAQALRAAGGQASAYNADLMTDVGAVGAVHHAIDAFGRLDIIVHNAGFSRSVPYEDAVIGDLDALNAVNTRAAALMAQAAWPTMKAQGHGRIVLVGSTAMYGMSNAAYYATAKAAYLGLTRSLAEAGRDHGIKINLIGPSGITRLADTIAASEFRDWFFATMKNELVTALVAYLAHESATVSGESFAAAGGRIARIMMGETAGIVDPKLTAETVRDRIDAIMDPTSFQPIDDYMGSAAMLMDALGYQPSAPLAPIGYSTAED